MATKCEDIYNCDCSCDNGIGRVITWGVENLTGATKKEMKELTCIHCTKKFKENSYEKKEF